MKRITINKKNILFIFMIIPFFRPIGIEVAAVPAFYYLGTLLELLAIAYLLIATIHTKRIFKRTNNDNTLTLKMYLLYTLFISCLFKFVLGNSEIQLIALISYFFAPFCVIYVIKKDFKIVLDGFYWYFFILNILNLLFYHIPVLKNVINDDWYFFSGHIQSTTMLWAASVFVGLIKYYRDENIERKSIAFTLLYIALPTMVMISAEVSTGILALFAYLTAYFFVFFRKKVKSINCIHLYTVNLVGLAFNYFLIRINIQTVFAVILYKYFNNTTSLNGRTVIWEAFSNAINKSLLLGYGYNGNKVNVGWGGGWDSLNYAHNTILQEWSNGGVIGLALFIIMSFFALRVAAGLKNIMYKKVILCLLAVQLVIMWSESMCFYNYYLLFIVFIVFMPKIDCNKV